MITAFRSPNNYDIIVSFGYLEKIGLGAHGETMEPNLDLEEIQKLSCLLKNNGMTNELE